MPYDGNGNYTLPSSYKVANGQKVLPVQHNPPFEDVKAALSFVVVQDGRKAMTGNLKMGGNRVTGAVDGIDPTDLATVGQAAASIGDGKFSFNDLGENWLRRDGGIYDTVDYPELAALLPALPDGVNWVNTNAITSGTVRKVQRTSTGYLMMVDDGTNARVYTAPPAADVWSQVATISAFRVYDFVLQAGVYVAVDGLGKLSRSSDGVTWSAPAAVLTFAGITGIAYAFGLFVIVGDGGKIATSPDSVTWTARTSGTAQFLFKIKLVNGVLVAIGATGTILSSTDGINWTVRTSGVTGTIYDVAYGAGLYVAVGDTGTIITSPTLVTWTVRSSGTTSELDAITYSTSGFLAAGLSGTVRISTAGTAWAASVTGTSVNFVFAGFDPDNQARYFVGGNGALYIGTRTLPTQFQIPDDGPNEWVRALAA